jgi:ATP-dependent Lon protease
MRWRLRILGRSLGRVLRGLGRIIRLRRLRWLLVLLRLLVLVRVLRVHLIIILRDSLIKMRPSAVLVCLYSNLPSKYLGMDFDDTSQIPLPRDPLDMIIGQEKAISIAKIAARQKRHMLLVGPPGVGKSMLAKSLAYHIPKPNQEIVIAHNPQTPERPFVLTRGAEELKRHRSLEKKAEGKIVEPDEIPPDIAERLGFRCSKCKKTSSSEEDSCPHCGDWKYDSKVRSSPFSDLLSQVFNVEMYEYPEEEVQVSRTDKKGKEEILVYQNIDGKVKIIDNDAFKHLNELEKLKRTRVLVPLKRNTFVQATGASETELLGDVKHDPWGGMQEAGGLQPYQRVVPGAIHEAHEGVLFVDELPQLERLQHHILTAMQEKHFPISGMNASSSGAAVKVNRVPCDFIFVGACNINEIEGILPPLRSRIVGSGYELLLETHMPKNRNNVERIAQFFSQEVLIDQKIAHGTKAAVEEIIKEAEKRALEIDGAKDSLTLRLRDLGGVIRLAGDLCHVEGAALIEAKHVREAVKNSRSVEQQLVDRYGSVWKGKSKDHSSSHLLSEERKATGYV